MFSLWKEGCWGRRWVGKVKRWFCPLKAFQAQQNGSHTLKSTIKSRLQYKWEIQGNVSANKMCWTGTKLLLKKLFAINNDYLQCHCKIIRGLRDRRVPGSSGGDLENSVTDQQTPTANNIFFMRPVRTGGNAQNQTAGPFRDLIQAREKQICPVHQSTADIREEIKFTRYHQVVWAVLQIAFRPLKGLMGP